MSVDRPSPLSGSSDRSLTITIVTGPWFPTPPGPAGAVERIWGDLARCFAQRGHKVLVLCRRSPGLPSADERDGVRTQRLTAFKQGRWVYFDLLKDALYSIRMLTRLPRGDIVVTNAFWLPILARLFKPGAGRVCMQVARVPKGQMRLYSKVDRLSVVSQMVGDTVVHQAPRLTPQVRLVHNPIDLRYFSPPAERHFTNSAGRQRVILFTGRIHPEKGLHVLVEAYVQLRKEFDDLHLRIIGPSSVDRGGGGEQYVEQLRSRARGVPFQIDEPIYDRAKLADALRAATYYCYPSLAEQGESFGVAPLEAMATGLAPVVSNLACFTEFLRDGENGVVFNHRQVDIAGALAGALRGLITNPDRTAAMGARAAETAKQFDYPIIADKFLDDFRELLQTPRP